MVVGVSGRQRASAGVSEAVCCMLNLCGTAPFCGLKLYPLQAVVSSPLPAEKKAAIMQTLLELVSGPGFGVSACLARITHRAP